MINKMLGKIQSKHYKTVSFVMYYIAVMALLIGSLEMGGFLTTKETETTGILFKKTVTTHYSLQERLPYLYGAIICFAIVALSLYVAIKLGLLPGKQAKYKQLIENADELDVQNIANVSGVSVKNAISDLQMMIDSGAITGYYIDYGNGVLINKNKSAVETEAQKASVTVDCKNCGAPVTGVKGESAKCEYCGNIQVI
ncbi:TFIIB-type zinc ribbon-containing protein [Weissella confusa]